MAQDEIHEKRAENRDIQWATVIERRHPKLVEAWTDVWDLSSDVADVLPDKYQ